MASNTIVVKGVGIRKERIANAAINPGHLVEVMSTDKLRVHASAGGVAQRAFAVENEVFGDDRTTAYAALDNVLYEVLMQGQELYAKLAASAPAIVIGDALESAGDGTLRKQVPGEAGDGLYDEAALAISAGDATDFKTTAIAAFKIGAVQYTKAATDTLSFTVANTINVGTASGFFFGSWLVQINAAGTISTLPAGGLADQVYTTAALAEAALPSPTAANVVLGHITIAANEDLAWTANTDDMTDASDVLTAVFVDDPTLTTFPSFQSLVGIALEAVDNSAGGAEVYCLTEVL